MVCSGNAPYIVRIGALGSRVVNPVYHASKSPGVFQRYYFDSSSGLTLLWLRTVQVCRYTCGCVRIGEGRVPFMYPYGQCLC